MLIHPYNSAREMGAAAAAQAAASIRKLCDQQEFIAVVFATGASQLETLRALTATPGLPWQQVTGFHMDEYLGIDANHPASFRHYLRQELVSRVNMRAFYEIDNNCSDYADLLRQYEPKLCLLGIGENGHLAFNDPPEADFNDPKEVKVVQLDHECRQQQVNEGWFPSLADVPEKAITLTIPTLLRIPELLLSVPGHRKRAIVQRTLRDEISTHCPATILRTHPNAHLYVDTDSYQQEA